MKIEIRGILQYVNGDHKYVDVVVTENRHDIYKKHRLGVDIKVTKDRILKFLSKYYVVDQAEIIWPEHIQVIGGDVKMSLPL